MRPRKEVQSVGESLGEGVTKQLICPFCKEDWEVQGKPLAWKPCKSMSVTREDTLILYHCFRAGCSYGRGAIHLLDFTKKPLLKEPSFKPQEYKYRTVPALSNHLDSKITLSLNEIAAQHIRYAQDRKTVVFPIFDSFGKEVGVVDRSYQGRDPKAITYWFNDVPKIHFPLGVPNKGKILLVEDIPSSIRAAPYIKSAALLGTSLTPTVLRHLRQFYDDVYIALDEDATGKALAMQKRYQLFFRNFSVVILSKDLKNMTDDEIESALGDIVST